MCTHPEIEAPHEPLLKILFQVPTCEGVSGTYNYEFLLWQSSLCVERRNKSSFCRLTAFGLRYAPEHPRSARKAL